MVVFGVERGNVDLLIFTFLTFIIIVSMHRRASYVSYIGIMFVGLLKFYPLVLLGTAIRERAPAFLAITIASAVTLIAFYFCFAPELHEIFQKIPSGGYFSDLFGASNLPRGLAAMFAAGRFAVDLKTIPPAGPAYAALVATLAGCSLLGGYLISRSSQLLEAYDRMREIDRRFLIAGAALIAGCFFAGQSIGYRGVYLIFVVAGLVALRRELSRGVARGLITALTIAILLLMWDGAFREALDGALQETLERFRDPLDRAFRKAVDGAPQELLSGPFRKALEHGFRKTLNHAWEWIRTLYWIGREVLWYQLAAFLIGALFLFGRRSPLLPRDRVPQMAGRAPPL
jgi:hypothetical protein